MGKTHDGLGMGVPGYGGGSSSHLLSLAMASWVIGFCEVRVVLLSLSGFCVAVESWFGVSIDRELLLTVEFSLVAVLLLVTCAATGGIGGGVLDRATVCPAAVSSSRSSIRITS